MLFEAPKYANPPILVIFFLCIGLITVDTAGVSVPLLFLFLFLFRLHLRLLFLSVFLILRLLRNVALGEWRIKTALNFFAAHLN